MSESPLKVKKDAFTGSNSPVAKRVARPLVRFLAQEAASGVLLLAATAVALIWANFFGDSYFNFWHTEIALNIGSFNLAEPLEAWVNDALMVLFFFVVGLEIKSELVVGDLSDPRVAAMPALAALGGMVVPALLYVAINAGGSGADGWGIPMATDIAFAVGVLALLGPSIPQRLKLFLLTLAIVDDIGAIMVIAIFYTKERSMGWLALAVGGLVLIALLRRWRVWYTPLYVILGVGIWFATFESGVHATIAGVALGLLAPAKALIGERAFENIEDIVSGDTVNPVAAREAEWELRERVSVCGRLIALISPWTSFFVVPVFALANAGIKITGESVAAAVTSPVALGIIVGLVIGKPLGIFLFAAWADKYTSASLPEGVTLHHVLGSGAVAGIGFTVALFINRLAFEDVGIRDEAVLGILVASLLASVVGWAILRKAGPATTK